MAWVLIIGSALAAVISEFWTSLFGFGGPFILSLVVGPVVWLVTYFVALFVTRQEKRRRKLWLFVVTAVPTFWPLILTEVALLIWRIRGFV
jgi:hypothetical protein